MKKSATSKTHGPRNGSVLAKLAAAPHVVWSILFIIAPLMFVVYFAFTNPRGEGTFYNIQSLTAYGKTFLLSVMFSLIATVVCLIIGYPLAYFLSRLSPRRQKVMVLLLMLPMWISLLIRTYSLMALLDNGGIISSFLVKLGFEKLTFIGTGGAVILGMVYDYLPFMIYPIYNTLLKMDPSYAEAAEDLGAKPASVFWKVTVPLSMPGVMSGILMVFMPTVSTFAISEFLTNNKIKLFGTIIQENINSSMWNYGAALSLIMLIIIGLTTLFSDSEKTGTEGGMI